MYTNLILLVILLVLALKFFAEETAWILIIIAAGFILFWGVLVLIAIYFLGYGLIEIIALILIIAFIYQRMHRKS
jgi:hypothetical protein